MKNLMLFVHPSKDFIRFKLGNVIGVDKEYEMIDILHVDVGNEGDILDKIIPHWIDKTRQFIIIEGGSRERDKIDWMVKYKRYQLENG